MFQTSKESLCLAFVSLKIPLLRFISLPFCQSCFLFHLTHCFFFHKLIIKLVFHFQCMYLQALKETLAEVRLCSRLEALMLKKKYLYNGDSPEIHSQKACFTLSLLCLWNLDTCFFSKFFQIYYYVSLVCHLCASICIGSTKFFLQPIATFKQLFSCVQGCKRVGSRQELGVSSFGTVYKTWFQNRIQFQLGTC